MGKMLICFGEAGYILFGHHQGFSQPDPATGQGLIVFALNDVSTIPYQLMVFDWQMPSNKPGPFAL